jgi:DNA-binding response OmpR family regulator
VVCAQTLQAGHAAYIQNAADLIILDLNLPDGDGLALCQTIRATSTIPVIILAARDLETLRQGA